jgi:lipopolysaccharide exporter
MSKNLASKAASGLKWGSASTVANAVMQVGYTAVMARLLAPEAFGLVAISGVVLRFGSYFANMGLSKALIQREELTQDNIRAAFTTSFSLGLLFTILTWLLAPYAVLIFDNPNVIPIVRVMSLAFLINGISMTAISLLEREMNFKVLGIIEISSYVFSYLIVGIVLAYLNYGVWSLVAASLVQAATFAILSYSIVRHNILLLFNWESYKPLFTYGSKMSVISFIEFLSANLDKILIGRFLGSFMLGLYDRAFMMINLPMYMLTRTISKVAMPSFSKIQNDNLKLGRVYLSSITLLASIVIPVCLGVLVAAPEIIMTLLGDQWNGSVPVLQVLCLAIPLSFITMFAGIVCDAKAVLNSKIVLNIVFIFIICGFFFIFRDLGLVGFGLAIFAGELVRMVMYQYVMNKELDLSYRQQISIYLPGIINGIITAVGIYAVSMFMRSTDLPAWLTLIVQIITGAVLLLTLTLLFPHRVLRTEIQTILARLGLNSNTTSNVGKIVNRYKHYIMKEA